MANKVSCIAAALLIISMANTSNSFAQNAKISAAIELSPYSQVIEKVFKSAGFSTTIEYFPGERSFQMSRSSGTCCLCAPAVRLLAQRASTGARSGRFQSRPMLNIVDEL